MAEHSYSSRNSKKNSQTSNPLLVSRPFAPEQSSTTPQLQPQTLEDSLQEKDDRPRQPMPSLATLETALPNSTPLIGQGNALQPMIQCDRESDALDEAFLQNEDRVMQSGKIPATVVPGSSVETTLTQGQLRREVEEPAFQTVLALHQSKKVSEILALYGYDWFRVKEHLAYVRYAKDEQEYENRLKVMGTLIEYRSKAVDTILEETLNAIAQQVINQNPSFANSNEKVKKNKTGYELTLKGKTGNTTLVASAPGSTSPTSDYDITFQVPISEDLEVDAVKHFNDIFRKRWNGFEPGVVFDTNVYTSGFMSNAAQTQYQSEFAGGEAQLKRLKASKHRTQMALSFLPIRQFFSTQEQAQKGSGTSWKAFKTNTREALTQFLRTNLKPGKSADKSIQAAETDLDEIFNFAQIFHGETYGKINQMKHDIHRLEGKDSSPGNHPHPQNESEASDERHTDAIVKDTLYQQQLDKIKKLLLERQIIVTELQELQGKILGSVRYREAIQKLQTRLADNLIRFEQEQGKALVFANEAYYTSGAATHVVKGMQSGGKVQLGRQQQMESLLMNIGYKLQHFEHQYDEYGLGRALVGTAKYGERIQDLVKRGSNEKGFDTQDKPLLKDGFDAKLYQHLQEDVGLLDQEKQLINEYKKGQDLKTPASKEAAAEQDFKPTEDRKHNVITKDNVELQYLLMAQNLLGPFYLDKLQTNDGKLWGG
ncbi:MAG: hypothetical protein MUF49_02890 [Oculatellaceae cyanobacterium Prado106]|jgi:hypothetical protein|nr:hypothetical protein [Oculatellaceae cyanobacterium Prado106]